MSRIDDLIAEHSPMGVPFRPMGEVGRFFRGRRFTKNDRVPTGIPSIHYGEIYTNYGTAARTALSHVRHEIDDQLRYAEHGDVVFASVGETVEDVGKAVAWLGQSRVAIHDDCFAFRSELDPVFVAYFSQTAAFKSQIERHVARAKVKRISARTLAGVEIPEPPLEVQRQIVRVLDDLTHLRSELEADLRAEITARRVQFEHYRNALLTFSSGGGGGVHWMPLSDVMQLRAGRVIKAAAISPTPDSEHEFPCYGGNGLRGYASAFSHEGPTILIGRQGALSGNVRRVDCHFYATEHALVASITDRIDRDWASHMLSAMDLNQYASRGALPGLAVGSLSALQVPVPSVEQQRATAAVLDAFGTLTDDLVMSLSAELVVRRDLYDHYRDRLLTFKELAA